MTILRFLLAAYALLTIFISGGLFFQKRDYSYLMLSLFTFLFGLEMLNFLYATSSVMPVYPYFYGRFYLFVGFLYGPVLLFHFNAFIKNKRIGKTALLHFIPFITAVALAAHYIVLPSAERILYLNEHFSDRIMPFNSARAIHIFGYGIFFIYLIYRNYGNLDARKRLYSVSFCSIYFLSAVLISWLTAFAEGWRQFIYYYLAASSIIFLIAFALYKNPEFLQTITKKYLSSSLGKSDMERIHAKISKAFKTDQIYLDGDLTIRKLGEVIDENPHYISQTLSMELDDNFNNYLNGFRIEHAKSLLLNPDYAHYKIEGIALESGFNNKVTFNRVFKEFTQTTPSSYRENTVNL